MKLAGPVANLTLITQGSDITDVNRNQSLNTLGNNLVKQVTSDSDMKDGKRAEEDPRQDKAEPANGQNAAPSGSLRDMIGCQMPAIRNISFDGQFINACPTAVLQNPHNQLSGSKN